MSIFLTNVITSAGAQLLRDCEAAEKKIVFTRARCGSQWDENRDGVGYHDAEWFDGAEGTITGVSVGGNVKVKASFSAVDSGTDPVKSVCICAQAKKDGVDPEYDEADDVIFAVSSDDNSGIISGIAFDVVFDMPTQCLGLVDAVGAVDDAIHTSGDQSIDGKLTVGSFVVGDEESAYGSVWVYNDDIRTELGYGLYIADTSNNAINFQSSEIILGDQGYPYSTMPLKCEYNTTSGTVDLTIGNGHKIRLTCTSVVEDPA